MDLLLRDARIALRSARRTPTLAITIVLTLALGLGVSTTVFGLIDAMMLRPLPVAEPGRLVLVVPMRADGTADDGVSIPEFEYLREGSRSLASLIAYDGTRLNAVVDGTAQMVVANLVSGTVFSTLGVRVMGTPLSAENDRPGAPPVAVASCQYATRQFGTPTAALGRSVMLNDLATTIIGVMPCDFPGLSAGETPEDVWLPMAWHPRLALNDHVTVGILARLAPGVDQRTAERELTVLHRRFEATLPSAMLEPGVIQVRDGAQGKRNLIETVATPLRVLSAAAIAILLLVCANAANLLLSRGIGRRHEMAIRMAIGASRRRLVQQLITETLTYAIMGGALGVLIAWQLGPLIAARLATSEGPLTLNLAPQARELAFAGAAVLITVILAGVGPALGATRFEPGRRATNRGANPRLGRSLAMLQVGLSLVLLIITSQLLLGIATLTTLEPGFDYRHQLQFRIYANTLGYSGARELAFYERLRSGLNALPGVRAASVSRYPVATSYRNVCHAPIDGAPADIELSGIGARFWDATGVALLRGRDFSAADEASAPPVAILSQEAARTFFPGADPIGQTLRVAGDTPSSVRALQVVGVTGDVRAYGERPEDVGAPTCRVFIPLSQTPATQLGQVVFVVRALGDPGPLFNAVRTLVHNVEPRAAILWPETGSDVAREVRAAPNALATSAGVLAALALVLACVGLYGVVSYGVHQRRNEMGIRLALGAAPASLFRMVLRDALKPVGAGAIVGLAGSLVALRVVGHSVIGLASPEPVAILAATATLATAAVLAAIPPARRAARADPVRALSAD